ncbi:MAG: tryptophan synthase alpha chain [Phycisphaerae bacterium]|jgi:tryptophan synthase alpha chain|nr:MAG: tryptophan synthase alpha chain [Phycisphaerae bacterium]
MSESRLRDAIVSAKQKYGIALMPFIAAGYPDLKTSLELIPALQQAGAAAIEVGFPFSDPIADGPVIQEAFTVALSKGLRIDQIFDAFETMAAEVSVPRVAMVSFSIVYRYGVEAFFRRAAGAGFAGVLIPDLPPPEADQICQTVRDNGLDTVLLVSPTTAPQRRQEIARLSSGFIYYLSLAGTTGERDQLPPDVQTHVQNLKQMVSVPVCVGFGISKPEHIVQLSKVADGAIVGSAIIRRIKENPADPVGAVQTFARRLLGSSV